MNNILLYYNYYKTIIDNNSIKLFFEKRRSLIMSIFIGYLIFLGLFVGLSTTLFLGLKSLKLL